MATCMGTIKRHLFATDSYMCVVANLEETFGFISILTIILLPLTFQIPFVGRSVQIAFMICRRGNNENSLLLIFFYYF